MEMRSWLTKHCMLHIHYDLGIYSMSDGDFLESADSIKCVAIENSLTNKRKQKEDDNFYGENLLPMYPKAKRLVFQSSAFLPYPSCCHYITSDYRTHNCHCSLECYKQTDADALFETRR